jgi:hypothetical protein
VLIANKTNLKETETKELPENKIEAFIDLNRNIIYDNVEGSILGKFKEDNISNGFLNIAKIHRQVLLDPRLEERSSEWYEESMNSVLCANTLLNNKIYNY